MPAKKAKASSAFTLVEALIVTAIASSLMLVVQMFFTHTVRSTMKGQDNLNSIEAASQIFSSLRKDMLGFTTLSSEGAHSEIPLDEMELPATATYSNMLVINKIDEVITYSLVTSSGKSYVERAVSTMSGLKRNLFGVPRMKGFDVIYVTTPNKVNSVVKNVGQIIISLIIDSDDKRFPSRELSLSSIFFSERLADADWNYLDF